MDTVLLTGATGFLGYHVAKRLNEAGVRPRVLELRDGRPEVLNRLNVERCAGYLDDPAAVRAACSGVGTVLHLAFKVSVGSGAKLVEEMQRINIAGTRQLLETAAASGVKRAVVAGSALAVGVNRNPKPLDESAELGRARLRSPIRQHPAAGRTERAGARLVEFRRHDGVPGVHVRSRRSRGRAGEQAGAVGHLGQAALHAADRVRMPRRPGLRLRCRARRRTRSIGSAIPPQRRERHRPISCSNRRRPSRAFAHRTSPRRRCSCARWSACSKWSARFAESRLPSPAKYFRSSGATPGTTPRRREPSWDGRRGRCARRSTDTIRWLQNPQSSCRRPACTGARGCRAMRRLIIVLVLAADRRRLVGCRSATAGDSGRRVHVDSIARRRRRFEAVDRSAEFAAGLEQFPSTVPAFDDAVFLPGRHDGSRHGDRRPDLADESRQPCRRSRSSIRR